MQTCCAQNGTSRRTARCLATTVSRQLDDRSFGEEALVLVWDWEVGMVPPTGLCSAAGKWRFYKAASAEDADEEKMFMCVRTYAATPLSGGAGCRPLSRSHLQA